MSDLIALRKKQLEKLDELIKSRFVEMFGDPVSNPYGYKKVVLSELADIKIGPFGSLLHKEDYITIFLLKTTLNICWFSKAFSPFQI